MKFFRIFFLLFLVIFPFGQLGRLPLGSGEVTLQLNDISAGFLAAVWILWHLFLRKRFILPILFKPIMLFLAAAFFSWLINIPVFGVNPAVFAYLLRWVAYVGIFFFLCEMFSEKKISQTVVFNGLIVVGVAVGILGIAQFFLYPDLRNLYYLGWDPHYFRVFSTFFDPAFTGVILVLTIILITIRGLEENQKRPMKWFLIGVIVAYLALALTYSRSSYIAFLAGMGAIAYLKRMLKLFLFSALVLLLTLIFIPKQEDRIGTNLAREETSLARIINWKQSLQIIKDHPIVGVGFNNYRQVQIDYGFLKEKDSHSGSGADSSLLFVWATTGIIGLVVYLWLGWQMTKIALRAWGKEKSIYGLALFSSLVAVFFHSFFVNSLFYPWVMEWVWILAAIIETSIGQAAIKSGRGIISPQRSL